MQNIKVSVFLKKEVTVIAGERQVASILHVWEKMIHIYLLRHPDILFFYCKYHASEQETLLVTAGRYFILLFYSNSPFAIWHSFPVEMNVSPQVHSFLKLIHSFVGFTEAHFKSSIPHVRVHYALEAWDGWHFSLLNGVGRTLLLRIIPRSPAQLPNPWCTSWHRGWEDSTLGFQC